MIKNSLGIVFPGQGSQSVGMLADIADRHPSVKEVLIEASDILGLNAWQMMIEGPASELDKTINTQPILLAASYAIWQILVDKNIKPQVLAGHSLGEYTALVCAGAISFADALKLVQARGHYMQEAVPAGKGALAAIVGLDDAAVLTLCNQTLQTGEVLTPVNYNSPGQVVVGGHIQAVERILPAAKQAGARLAKMLTVSVPSHCELMKPAAEQMAKALTDITIKSPIIPIINNVDVAIYTHPDQIRDGLIRQLYLPVRWVELVQQFSKQAITTIIECGPGKVLTGLNKRIIDNVQLLNTADLASLQLAFEALSVVGESDVIKR